MSAAVDDLIPADDDLMPPEDDPGQAGHWAPTEDEDDGDDDKGDGWTDGTDRETVLLINGKEGPKKHPENERWLSARLGAGPLSWVFVRNSSVVRVVGIGEKGYIEPPNPEASNGPATVGILKGEELSTRLADHYLFVVRRGTKEKPRFTEEWFPASDAARALATPDRMPFLRVLRGVTHTPLLRAEKGSGLLTEPGYDDESGFLYMPDGPNSGVPAVPSNPTDAELAAATALLRGLVADFMWTGPHHEANYLGALVTPLLRLAAPPPYKQVLITARERGSGKTLLADIPAEVHGATQRPWPTDDAELEKVLSSILSQTTAPVAVFDNVRGVLRSARWEMLLTRPVYSGRILGSTNNVDMANDRLWVLTGNNLTPGGDLDRRSLWVDIDPRCPKPELRTEFDIPNLKTFVIEHRGEILAALLTWLAAWDARGRPQEKPAATDFGRWVAVVRGVLTVAGVPGTFDHESSQDRQANPDTAELEEFYTAVREVVGNRAFTVNGLLARVKFHDASGEVTPAVRLGECLPGDVGEKVARAGRAQAGSRSLGKWFGNHKGQWYSGLAILPTGEKGREGAEWRVLTKAEADAERVLTKAEAEAEAERPR